MSSFHPRRSGVGFFVWSDGMQITLNGEKREVPDNVSVSGLLGFLAIQHQRVAVELNEMIVKKDRYAETVVKDGDSLEVVAFMGGGSGR